ncbi:MAG: hypothetical protein Fur002_22580 [Anaerolineales bacterium]
MTKNKFLFFIVLAFALSGCVQELVTPTPQPPDYLPTVVALTGEAAFATQRALTPAPTITPTATLTFTPPPTSSIPTETPTPEPGFTKYADLRFISPGPLSSLVSPVDVKLLLTAGKSDLVRVDLLGEDGRALYTDLIRVDHQYAGTLRTLEVTFETRAVSEKGYFRLSTKDENKNLQSLNTMPVLLYSVGTTTLTLPGNLIYERALFEGIKNKDDVFGGEIRIKGKYWPFNEQPVFLDLMLADGKIITTRVLAFNGIEPQLFETTLPYKVSAPTSARIAIHQDNPAMTEPDPTLKKYIYYYSVEVTLNP